jgi:hypothetical protein
VRWRLGCYPPALELVSFSFTTARVAGIGRKGGGTAGASKIGRSGGDLYVTYGSGKATGFEPAPLRPSATSCDYPHLSATAVATSCLFADRSCHMSPCFAASLTVFWVANPAIDV